MTDVTFTFRVDRELKEAFVAMAEEQDMSAAQLLRRMMRDEVEQHREEAAHEHWLQREIGDAMHDTGKPRSPRFTNEAIAQEWRQERNEIERGDDA